jgi:hypothetical protein
VAGSYTSSTAVPAASEVHSPAEETGREYLSCSPSRQPGACLSDNDIGRIAGRVHGEVREITCVVQLILVGKACDYRRNIGYFAVDNGSLGRHSSPFPSAADAVSMGLVKGRLVVLGVCALLAGGCRDGPAIFVPATHGTIEMPFRIGMSGAGTRFVGDISIKGNVGTLTIGGRELHSLAYAASFNFQNYDVYTLLTVAPERWYIVYLYCQAGQLVSAWHESTAGDSVEYEEATGRCDELPAITTKALVDFPGTMMPVPPLLQGFQIVGSGVSITDGQPGWVVFGPTRYEVFVFATVDCTDCGNPGWRELHAIFWDGTTNRTGFCIFYLNASPNSVLVQYALSLPDLERPVADGLLLDGATWSAF